MVDTTDETTTGGNPKPKTPDELLENPHEKVNPEVLAEMGADMDITKINEMAHSLEISPEEAKGIWDGATKGATHKITACMSSMKGKVKDEAAFCQSLATKVGYKAE